MSLEGAFRHVKAARPVITPNLAFLNQLAAYELKCRNGAKEQCSLWNEHTHQNGITRRLPAFILAHFLEDYDHLFDMVIHIRRTLSSRLTLFCSVSSRKDSNTLVSYFEDLNPQVLESAYVVLN